MLVGKIWTNTAISWSIAGMVCFWYAYFVARFKKSRDKYSLGHLCNGILAWLVGVTAVCNACPSWAAFIIGIISAFIYISYSNILVWLKIDDPLDASSVHLWCGSWWLVALWWFHEEKGILFGWGWY